MTTDSPDHPASPLEGDRGTSGQLWRVSDSVQSESKLLPMLLFLSGSCGLAYEVLYQRALSLLLGDAPLVNAALFGTFLLGLGVSARVAFLKPRWLPFAELSCGLYALSFPVLLSWLQEWSFLATVTGNLWASTATACILMLPPSLCLGMAIPLFAEYLRQHSGTASFHRTYLLYHLGALLGAVAVEFWMLGMFGKRLTFWSLGLINLVIGVTLLLRFRHLTLNTLKPRDFPGRTLAALFCASAGSALFQMILLSYTFHLFHPHRENFTLVLLLVFFSLSLGSVISNQTEWHFHQFIISSVIVLSLTFALLGWLSGLYYNLPPGLPAKLLILSMVGVPVLTLFGAFIPSLMKSESAVSRESGLLLWYSALGNATGYLTYSLVLQQWLSKLSIVYLIVGLLMASLLLLGEGFKHRVLLVSLPLLIALGFGWTEAGFHLPRSASRFEVSIYKSGPDTALLFTDGENSYVAHNGHASIRTEVSGRVNFGEVFSGIAAFSYSPRTERALVMGHGSGITAGTVAQLFQHTDVVEINDAFLKMSPELAHLNFGLSTNPKAWVIHADARAFLVGKSESYDLILNSITRPTYFAAAKVYTEEFFQLSARALKPDGVFATWISDEMSGQEIVILLNTLSQVFPHAALHQVDKGYFLVLCSQSPLEARNTLKVPEIRLLMEERFPGLVVDEVVKDLQVSSQLFEGGEVGTDLVNRDDKPILEFTAVRAFEKHYRGFDPLKEYAKAWKLDPVRIEESPARVKRRAEVYKRMNSKLYSLFPAQIKD